MTHTKDQTDFPGIWHLRYWYQDTKHENKEATSEYNVVIEKQRAAYVLHSLVGQGESSGSHIEARFMVDGIQVTGTYIEGSSPSGLWEGMTYTGAFQLLLNEDQTRMEGLWVGAGYNNGQPKEFTGRWELVKISDN